LNNDQLDFAFVAELPSIPVVAKARKSRTPKPTAPAIVTQRQDPIAVDVEPMAQQLDAHPDYRVLRRLKPCLDWPVRTPEQKICRVVVLDTETTGLDQSKEKIIELALLRVDVDTTTGMPVGSVQVYDGLEDPGIPISKEIESITGINDSMVRGQRLDEARVVALLEGVDLVIAHNAGFDRPFVEARLPQFRALAWACSFADIGWKSQGRNSAKLESLALEMGYFYDAHRAEMDCHALLAVLASPLPALPHTGLAHLVEQAGHPSYRLEATGAPFDAKDKLKARGYRWNVEQKVWHTRIDSEQDLSTEYDWLKQMVYANRTAVVQVEKLDASVRYSNRGGTKYQHQL
jgi:DNA polymerase-3 subunit epsilon